MSRAKHRLSGNLLTPAAFAAGVLLWFSSCSSKPQRAKQEQPLVGSTVVFAAASGGVSADRFAAMRWEDIEPTAQSALRHGLSVEVMKVSSGINHPPCLYLRGILELAHSRPAEALAEWEKIPLEQIPVDALYAPWRLADATSGPNRYADLLSDSVKNGRASSLVAARWYGISAEFLPALEEYLKTDPAQWTRHEVEQFRIMKLHAPVAADVDRLLAGALRGKRLPRQLRGALARLIKEQPLPDSERVAEMLENNPEFASAATRAAAQQLELRQAFAANRFDEVVEKTRSISETEASSEMALLAFLSASQVGDRSCADRWAEELLRRNPETETQTWIDNIRKSSR